MRTIKSTIIFFIVIFCFFACSKNHKTLNLVEEFPNTLNIKNIPKGEIDWKAFAFFDKGSWFGYALPDKKDYASLGTFSGPFLLTSGRWLSEGLCKINIYNAEKKEKIDLRKAKNISINYFPGRLEQVYEFHEFSIKLKLIFISKYTALINMEIFNGSKKELKIKYEWVCKSFDTPFIINEKTNTACFKLQKENMKFYVVCNKENIKPINTKTFKLLSKEIFIKPSEDYSTQIYNSINYNDEKFEGKFQKIISNNIDTEKMFTENKIRWNTYLQNGLTTNSIYSQNTSYKKMAVKCINTLMNNWKGKIGALKNEGIIPSYAISYFNGFWAWDSWKHAVAMVNISPELAKNQIRVMFAKQKKNGMIPDVIYADSTEDNWRDSKPPLSAWAVWKVYETTEDKDFVKEMYPAIKLYHEWWYNERDHDKNGLCEYGGTDSALVTAMWESGMDDAVRFDKAKMLKNKNNSWSVNQESVDLNSYLFAEKIFLSKMAKLMNKKEESKTFLLQANKLKKLINSMMYDEKSGFYYDINVADKSFINVQGTEGWIPLWAKVADTLQAERVKKIICDTTKFATYLPLPTVAADNPNYMSGYWRGPVWLDQAYFGIKGLQNYGFDKVAENFIKQIFEKSEGLINSNLPIRENYNPRNGKGLNVNHFSWSSAHLLLLYLEK